MSRSSIEWLARPGTLPESWNFITGCNKVDRGCKHCYAEIMHRRLQFMYPDKYDHDFLTGAHVHEELLQLPYSWKKPRTVFVNSMSDLFHAAVPFNTILHAWAIMAATPQHTYIIATKRIKRAREYFDWLAKECLPFAKTNIPREYVPPEERVKLLMRQRFGIDVVKQARYPLKNVWLLASVHTQEAANLRIPELITLPVYIKGISAEPLLGPIDIEAVPMPRLEKHSFYNKKSLGMAKIHYLDWIIAGGESGHKAEPVSPAWIRRLQVQAAAGEVPFFFKQWGEYAEWTTSNDDKDKTYRNVFRLPDGAYVKKMGKKAAGRELDGRKYNEYPFDNPYCDNLPF